MTTAAADILPFWGYYCPQCRVWLVKTDGFPVWLPSPYMAASLMATDQLNNKAHLWVVTEFGQEKPIDMSADSSWGVELCPTYFETRRRR